METRLFFPHADPAFRLRFGVTGHACLFAAVAMARSSLGALSNPLLLRSSSSRARS